MYLFEYGSVGEYAPVLMYIFLRTETTSPPKFSVTTEKALDTPPALSIICFAPTSKNGSTVAFFGV